MNVCLVLLSATLACLVLLSSLHSARGQAYHFSNGWNPGKKRSSSSSPVFAEPLLAALGASDDNEPSSVLHSLGAASPCTLRPSIKKLIMDLIEIELRRVSEECIPETEWISNNSRDRSNSKRNPWLSSWLAKHSPEFSTDDRVHKRK